MDSEASFQWKCQPQAEEFLLEVVEKACQTNPFIEHLRQDLLHKTSTRLFDWLDHVTIYFQTDTEIRLKEAGFILDHSTSQYKVYFHPGAQLPKVVLQMHDHEPIGLAVSVDSIADFLMVRGIFITIEGTPYSGYRCCQVSLQNNYALWVVERRGEGTMVPIEKDAVYLQSYLEAVEKWKTRPRSLEDQDRAMEETLKIAKELIASVGQNCAAWIILEVEREYWQSRNLAAQTQKNRQDRLGMGWANHDHHTFRSSRRYFHQLIRLFELLGFHCRERFYAGKEAGWGAQVMENPACRLILFLDVDLSSEEIQEDFAHQKLAELPELGTVGLWCALHGDSILKSGMHHLEAQFMFDELKEDLAQQGVSMMNPFSSYSYLRQAFTVGEMWQVEASRIQKLEQEGKITSEHAQKFLTQGAIGSHLENLQRREGYKGFNQKNVSVIIKKTDPRQN